jgi:hypothetical protein
MDGEDQGEGKTREGGRKKEEGGGRRTKERGRLGQEEGGRGKKKLLIPLERLLPFVKRFRRVRIWQKHINKFIKEHGGLVGLPLSRPISIPFIENHKTEITKSAHEE